MKKLIIGLLASLLMAAGLVGATGTSANAAQCDRYGVCVKPSPEVKDKDKQVKPGKKAKLQVKFKAPGDAKVEGTLKMIITKVGDPDYSQTVEKDLNGNGGATLRSPKLSAGEYLVTWKFIPKDGTPWERIDREYKITVG